MSDLKPRICVASHHNAVSALLADPEFAALAQDPGYLLELRLDRYTDADPAALQAALLRLGPQQCLVTCRRIEEGGGGCVPEEARVGLLEHAVRAGAAYVDVELATWQTQRAAVDALHRLCTRTQLVVSAHDFTAVPPLSALRRMRADAEALGAHVVKIAVQPARLDDGWPLLQLSQEETPWTRPFLGLAMGEAGLWSRLVGPRLAHPAPFTFARGEQAPGTAPGQPTWRELSHMYRFATQTRDAPLYGVIGDPIAHSLSPWVHNAALAACGLPGMYMPWRVEGDPTAFLQTWAPALGIRGLSVTLPHKETALLACREVSPLARGIGAVNTLTQPLADGTWYGDNTDAAAAIACLQEGLGRTLQGTQILVLGAGGVAKAVAHAARHAGATVLIANRTNARAAQLAQAIGGQVLHPGALPALHATLDAVVNGTSVGMAPNVHQSPLQADEIPARALIFDTIYAPPQTQLLRWAAEKGCKTVGGAQMFLAQAAAQFEAFTGQRAPVAAMQAALVAG